jgi:hypothetical protein
VESADCVEADSRMVAARAAAGRDSFGLSVRWGRSVDSRDPSLEGRERDEGRSDRRGPSAFLAFAISGSDSFDIRFEGSGPSSFCSLRSVEFASCFCGAAGGRDWNAVSTRSFFDVPVLTVGKSEAARFRALSSPATSGFLATSRRDEASTRSGSVFWRFCLDETGTGGCGSSGARGVG